MENIANMNKQRNFKKGQAMTLLLVFAAVSIIIITAAVSVLASNSIITSRYNMGEESYAVAQAGVDNAILRLVRDHTYGGETLTIGNGSATITVGSTTLINFPVYVGVTADTGLAADAQSDADDILFTYGDGTTKLSHEIERFTKATGLLSAYVKVPVISNFTEPILYMYYGNSTTSNQQRPENVWDSNFLGVWHLSETSGSQFDSTTYNNDFLRISVSQQGSATGMIAGADSFVYGSSHYLQANTSPVFTSTTSNFTLEAWFKPSYVVSPDCHAIVNGDDGNFTGFTQTGLLMEICGRRLDLWEGNNSVALYTEGIDPGIFYYGVAMYDRNSNTFSLYKDAIFADSDSLASQSAHGFRYGLNVGRSLSYGGEYFDGVIDEVRISNIARDYDWIKTTYENISSPAAFLSIGTSELQTGGYSNWYDATWPKRKKITIDKSKIASNSIDVIITSIGVVGNFKRTIQVTGSLNDGNFTINTWQEI